MSATTVAGPAPARTRPASSRSVVVALGVTEARRLLRSPLLWVGLALVAVFTWTSMHSPDDWSGARYQSAPILVGPLLVVISILVAGSFHRERLGVSTEAPVGETVRAAGRLVGALALITLVLPAPELPRHRFRRSKRRRSPSRLLPMPAPNRWPWSWRTGLREWGLALIS